jgi:hypothetical protein
MGKASKIIITVFVLCSSDAKRQSRQPRIGSI